MTNASSTQPRPSPLPPPPSTIHHPPRNRWVGSICSTPKTVLRISEIHSKRREEPHFLRTHVSEPPPPKVRLPTVVGCCRVRDRLAGRRVRVRSLRRQLLRRDAGVRRKHFGGASGVDRRSYRATKRPRSTPRPRRRSQQRVSWVCAYLMVVHTFLFFWSLALAVLLSVDISRCLRVAPLCFFPPVDTTRKE